MIRDVAGLLRALQEAEAQQLDKASITHAPTIGEMYEGLTEAILGKLIPGAADLRVVSGFVEDASGGLSGQIDSMLVSGKGRRIPHTRHFKWPVKDVIAVLEVKKRLFSSEMVEAHRQLKDVLDRYWRYVEQSEGLTFDVEPALYAYGQITGRVAPDRKDLEKLPFHLEMIYRALVVEQISPIRIIFGYSGFTSEFTFRQGFCRLIKRHVMKGGFGASFLPNLIVCGQYSLVKLNGYPYMPRMQGEWWPLIASSKENPLIFLLELIWTRLSYRLAMPEWFDADLSIEALAPLLAARATTKGGKMGWEYLEKRISKSSLEQKVEPREWEPHIVSLYQFTVVNALCREGALPLDHPSLVDLTGDENVELQELFEKRLIARNGDNLVLLTRRCRCVIMPKEGYVVGDDSSGRLTAWVMKRLKNRDTEST